MKKLSSLLLLALLVLLAACGQSGGSGTSDSNSSASDGEGDQPTAEEPVELVVGASVTPHAEILEHAKPLLEEKGVILEIETFTDYVMPNKALESGDLDANYFQHIPYLEAQKEEFGYDFVNAGGIHIEPMGFYSQRIESLSDLPEDGTIIISNSVSDTGRTLALLEKEGVITLDESVNKADATLEDIVENPKNITIRNDVNPELLTATYENDEADAIAINTNFAIDADLNPLEDAIALEGSESPYVNIIAVRSEDKDNEAIKTLVEVLHSDELQTFMEEEFQGALVPVSE
ncbi:D-methionine transport system substrate-binding protein [Aureibacillus halotolerans]|uniref:Lipoprotein n=2 Tax=Aureibacillus halotolerans TaxID=1508390 RepID=A0A4R6U378_9BACI|nr:D-methionine transport system substrate-binding protein [Aureibacillus halotolerans]